MLALFVTFIAMELSLYITYDTAGASAIIGVESRYFLPFLPFFMFPLAMLSSRWLARLPAGLFALPAVIMALVNIYALPDCIYHLLRVPGP